MEFDDDQQDDYNQPSVSFNQIDLNEKDDAEAPHTEDDSAADPTPRTKKRKRKRKVNANVVANDDDD